MNTKLILASLCIALLGATAQGAPAREKFTVPQGAPADLLNETNSLKLDKESGVQQVNAPSSSFISVMGGVMAGTNLNVSSYGHIVNYDFSQQLPLATFQFTHYLLTNKLGKWGLNGSLGYSYSAYYQTATPTALHVVPVEAALVYRGEWSSTQKVMPYLMAGPGTWIYFQRGLDEYNTSEAILMGTATAGVAVNLNRLGWLNSRNDTEVIFQFQRNFSSNDPNNNINGNTIEIGGSLAL